MRAHVLQHEPFEEPGSIVGWLANHRAVVGYSRLFDGDPLPSLDGIDLVVALGGAMSVNDEAELPWLLPEKRFVRSAIERGTPLLGICLGAQLIASAMGSRVFRALHKEIGWFPIQAVESPPGPFRFPESMHAFHWHGETFDLPADAVHLARSEACEHQAFRIGRRVLALQFHLEATPESAASLVAECGHEIVPGAFIQPAAEILAVPASAYASMNMVMDRLLDALVG